MPISCEAGSFANVTGLSVCWDCPEGYYCTEGKQDLKIVEKCGVNLKINRIWQFLDLMLIQQSCDVVRSL